MSSGYSSSCCTASFQRYTERQGASTFTHAARRCSIRRLAMRSATARSGTLVNTNSALMLESLVNGGVAQAHAEQALHACVVEAARLGHERVALRRHAARDLAARQARRMRQAASRADA